MKIETFAHPTALAQQASTYIAAAIRQKPNLLLCAATGNTPTLCYQNLVARSAEFPTDELRLFKLDEWGGVPPDNPGTCETYLQTQLIQPLGIGPARYFAFQSDPADPLEECTRVQQLLAEQGPIDLCILGLGLNGHIAFNEPATSLQPHCHVAQLSAASLGHSMTASMPNAQLYGLTLGMADILAAREILLLISGESKKAVTARFLEGRIRTDLPASLLWLHGRVRVMISL
jgi:galactosamine-6-phosphate isomerase